MDKQIKKETIKRLVQWAKEKPQPPIRIDLEPTLSCNLKCKFCWQRSEERIRQCNYSNPLSEERMLQLIDEAADYGVLEWQIAGGWEPMIKPRFCMQLMTKIKEKHMYGCLTTNGTLFQEKAIKHLVQIGWDQILFSLEGPNAKIHDYITGVNGSFNKSIKAMALFNTYKKRFHQAKPVYSFHSVLTNKNYIYLKEMISWGKKLGINGVCFEPLNVWSKEGNSLKLNEQETREFQRLIPEATRYARKMNMPTNLGNLGETALLKKQRMDNVILNDLEKIEKKEAAKYALLSAACFNPWLNLEIRISGHVVPCRLCDSHQYASTLHNKSLKEIWLSNYFMRFRQHIIKKKLPRYCKTCASGVVVDFREIRKELQRQNRFLARLAKMW